MLCSQGKNIICFETDTKYISGTRFTKIVLSSLTYLNDETVLCRILLSPASEASREVANLTERKNQHTPIYGVKNLSICLSVTKFDPNYRLKSNFLHKNSYPD